MHKWAKLHLERLAADERSAISKPYGSAIFKEDYRRSGVPVVRGVNLARGVFHDDDFVFIEDELANRMPGAEMRSGDLVVTHRGTVGQVSMIPRESRFERYVASTSHVKVRLDLSKALPEFYYYWFASPAGKRSILDNASTVGVPGIAQPVATVKRLLVPHPPIHEQRAIAELLGALDDKITVNTSTHVAVQALVDALYLGELKKGEYSSPLGAVTEFLNRRRIPLSSREREARPGNIPYYGAAGRLDHVDQALFDEELVLVGEDGSVFADDGTPVIQYIWGPAWVNNHAHVLRGAGMSTPLLHAALRQTNVAHLVTGAVQLKLSMGNLRKLHLRIPTSRSRLEARLGELAAMQRSIAEESRVLAATRDELLALLMSGKVTVRQAEKTVGEVV
jgi:type I restriction enzyme S subunit